MNGFEEANVPSTHYPNPFPIRKEPEPMKLTIKHKNGEIFEYDLSLLNKPIEEMSNMDYVLAWIKAHEVETVLRRNTNVITNVAFLGFEAPRVETFVEVNDEVLDAKLLVDKFLKNQLSQEKNYHPGYMYSYKFFRGKHGLTKSKAEIIEMLVSDIAERSNNEDAKQRFMISFNSYVANTAGSHYKKKWPYALMVNRTNDGLRAMWVRVNGKKGHKFVFGTSYSSMSAQKFVPKELEQDVYRYLTSSTTLGDWLPIMKYMNQEYYSNHVTTSIHPFGITMSNLYWIGGSTDVKAIVNKAYGKSGVEGVTKHMFGGRNNIDSFVKLELAIWFARVLRDFPATIFNEIELDNNTEVFHIGEIKDYQKFFKIFGVREHYIQEMNAKMRNKLFDGYEIVQCPDTVRIMKLITNKEHRNAIINHVKNNTMSFTDVHNFVSSEYAKIRQQNKQVEKTAFTNKFLKHQGAWVSDEIQMIVPTESHELIEWGAVQNNCIGSYGSLVAAGESMIVGFKDADGQWIGHAEVSKQMKLNQLLGKHNKTLEDKDRSVIVEFLQDKVGVDITSSYWGS